MQAVCIIIMRINIYKNKILKLLEKNHLLGISDIHKKVRDANYSTIYRNVEQLVSDSLLKKIILDKDRVVYEINNSRNNHDHFVCTDCGDIEEINISENLQLSKKYKIKDLLVRGSCQDCNKN
jgi:Fe2+ or Zn2+ uptake regulation protein